MNSSLVNFLVFRLAIFCYNIKVREEGFLKVIETHTVGRDSCSTLGRTSARISTVVVKDVAMLYVHNNILAGIFETCEKVRLQYVFFSYETTTTKVHGSPGIFRASINLFQSCSNISPDFVYEVMLAAFFTVYRSFASKLFT